MSAAKNGALLLKKKGRLADLLNSTNELLKFLIKEREQMSAEAVLIKKQAKALQKIANLPFETFDQDWPEPEADLSQQGEEITRAGILIGLNRAAEVAKEALKGIVVT